MCEGGRRLPFKSIFLVDFKRWTSIDPGFKKKFFARVIEANAALPVSWPGHGSLSSPKEKLRGFEADIKKTWLNKNTKEIHFALNVFQPVQRRLECSLKRPMRIVRTSNEPTVQRVSKKSFQVLARVPMDANIHLNTTKTKTFGDRQVGLFLFDLIENFSQTSDCEGTLMRINKVQ